MQDDLQRQLDQRTKAREGQNLDAKIAAIDAETEQQNAAVDAERDRQFDANANSSQQRTADTEEFTAGVRDTLDEMRRQSKADAATKRAERSLAEADRQSKVAQAEADFQAAVSKANALKPAENEQTSESDTTSPQISNDLAAAIAEAKASLETTKAEAGLTGEEASGDERIQKLQAGIAAMEAKAVAINERAKTDGKLKLPPAELDDDTVALELDRDAQASIDNFAGTDVGDQSKESVTGKFDSRGLNIGSGARRLEPVVLNPTAEKLEPIADELEPEVIVAPKLIFEEPPDDNVPAAEEESANEFAPGLQKINDRLITIGEYLMKSNELLAGNQGNVNETGDQLGLGLSEDVERAIVETANNTRKLAEQSSGRGLVFS